ncbi:hypothetical protein JOM56_006015 [Amanita muscaria]
MADISDNLLGSGIDETLIIGSVADAVCTASGLNHGRPSSTNQCLRENLLEETTDYVPKSDIEPAPIPIYRLPADVLCSIIELYCQVELPVTFPLRFDHPQLIASQVCSAWRQIMLDNPMFWNRIAVAISKYTHYDQMVKAIRIWLSRAKDLPCCICLSLLYDHPLFQLNIHEDMVRDVIAPHKCKSLAVTFADHHLHDLLHLPDEKLSCIENLYLYHIHHENSRETVSMLDFHRLTNLTSFSLKAFVLRHGHPMVPRAEDQYFQIFSGIPWHQLRHIHLDAWLPVLRCLTILETSSPVLETCSLFVSENLSFATSPLSQITPIHCQQLREFKAHINPGITLDAGDSFLLLLRLPKLKSLTLHYHKNVQVSTDFQTLLRMHGVCPMRLEQLSVFGLS